MASLKTSSRNGKSGQEVAKNSKGNKKAKWPKTHARHWEGRLFKNTFTVDGKRQTTADWCVRISHKGRRETFNLATPNAEAAGPLALEIYRTVTGAGWDAALIKHKPKAAPKQRKPAIIGAWLEAVKATTELRPNTFTTYSQCLRQIAAEIKGIGDQPGTDKDGKPITLSRFDYRTGGRAAWIAKVDALPLSLLTGAEVQRWKVDYIGQAGDAPDARKRAENSAASLIRSARALFSAKCRKFADAELILPDPLPFAGVELPKKGKTKYQSKIDAPTLIESAKTELSGNRFKIFVLAACFGLRKREIDLLAWPQIDLEKAVIRLERTEHFAPKSEDSIGEIDIDPELIALLKEWKGDNTGGFVIESKRSPRHSVSRTNYRCEPDFEALYAWLRSKGVTASKPLHELRKELGAILASTHGIFAAQSVLRHARISTTADYYADKKTRISAGLGKLLSPPFL